MKLFNLKFITTFLILMISFNIGSYSYSMEVNQTLQSEIKTNSISGSEILKTKVDKLSEFLVSLIFTDISMLGVFLIILPLSFFIGNTLSNILTVLSFVFINGSFTYSFKGRSKKGNSYLYTLLGSFLGIASYTATLFLVVYLSSFFFNSISQPFMVLQGVLYALLMPAFATYGASYFYDWNEEKN